jgi:hypothetical protein
MISVRERLADVVGYKPQAQQVQTQSLVPAGQPRRFGGGPQLPRAIAPKAPRQMAQQYTDVNGDGDDDYDLDNIPEALERPAPRRPSCLAPDGRAKREVGRLIPFVPEEASFSLIFDSTGGGLFAALVTAGTLATDNNRRFLVRGSSQLNDKIDGRWVYAVGLDVDVSVMANDIIDREASEATEKFIRDRLMLVGLRGSSDDTQFLAGVPARNLKDLPLRLRPDQVNLINQDGWCLRFDYPGKGRLNYGTLRDATVKDQVVLVTLRGKAWLADTKDEAVRLAQGGVYNPLTQEFELMG